MLVRLQKSYNKVDEEVASKLDIDGAIACSAGGKASPFAGVCSLSSVTGLTNNEKNGSAEKSSQKRSMNYDLIYDYIAEIYGFDQDEMTYLKANCSGLLLALYGARICSSADVDKILERIQIKLKLFHAPVYGEILVGNEKMDDDKINANAEYIYWYLRDKGWSKEAICGLLGNMYEESKVNPGVWQNGVNSSIGGYGLVQYTSDDRKAFFKYMEKLEYTVPDGLNELVRENPKDAINCQLDYLMQSERKDVARAYIRYRYKKEVARKVKDDFIAPIKDKLEAANV
jgi:hypothetical protein